MKTKFYSFLTAIFIFGLTAVSFEKANAELFMPRATVSYYAEKFHGKQTANGEIFNMYDFTCAHKSLPFNTVLRITNLENGKSVEVRVNDRGPFVAGREVDLSKAAAEKLDMIKSGVATVKIEILSLGAVTKQSAVTAAKATGKPVASPSVSSAPSAAPSPIPQSNSNAAPKASAPVPAASTVTTIPRETPVVEKTAPRTVETVVKLAPMPENAPSSVPSYSGSAYNENLLYDIQLGSYTQRENAEAMARKLLKDGFNEVAFQTTDNITRVVIRKVSGADVEAMKKALEDRGYINYFVKMRQ